MNTESLRIADQLRRSLNGDAWHGPCLQALLSGVNEEQACARPLPSAHCIWELVLHIDVWTGAALEAAQGIAMPKLYGTEKDWPAVANRSAAAWVEATHHLFQTGDSLAQAIAEFPDARLQDIVPGRQYDFYHLFHGVVQHSLYHGGQIALLKRAVSAV